MVDRTITSANSIYMLSVSSLFPTPVQLQGFSADDIFTTQPLASAETSMGLDGRLSAGFVYVPVVQSISLQADSLSNDLFDQWNQSEQLAKEKYIASGIIQLSSIGKQWSMVRGFLTNFPPIPDSARTLRPRRYAITWNAVGPSNV